MPASDPLDRLVVLVDQIRDRQELDGRIKNPGAADRALVAALINVLQHNAGSIDGLTPQLLSATVSDLQHWARIGLDQRPLSDATLAAFQPPEPNQALFFLAFMRATNGPAPEGMRLELVSGVRCETRYLTEARQYTGGYVAPFQCIKLGAASFGFRSGHCIVLFPESIAAASRIAQQTFALFFFSKFQAIYYGQTLVEVERLFGVDKPVLHGKLTSRGMLPGDVYDARCLWGYYHDYAHHSGPRPLDRNLYIKMNWFTGLLEEIKCDLITVRLVQKNQSAFWREIVEFVLLDRLFRYPKEAARHLTFDGGTGILLFEILAKTQALYITEDGWLRFDPAQLPSRLDAIIAEIEALEGMDDDRYQNAARAYVQGHLGQPPVTGARFDLPRTQYARQVLARAAA